MKIKVLINCLLVAALFSTELKAQKESLISKFNNLYMFGEYGRINGYSDFIQGGAVLQIDHHYLKIKNAVAFDPVPQDIEDFHEHHKNCECVKPSRQVVALSLVYGKNYAFWKRHLIQFGVGISYVERSEYDDEFNKNKQSYELTRFIDKQTVGLPIEIKYALHLGRGIGLTCTAHGNINGLKSYKGLTGGISLGLF